MLIKKGVYQLSACVFWNSEIHAKFSSNRHNLGGNLQAIRPLVNVDLILFLIVILVKCIIAKNCCKMDVEEIEGKQIFLLILKLCYLAREYSC